jgi:transcription factor-like protein
MSPAATGWAFDLGLMNYYTSHTYATLPGATQTTWKDDVSREAVDHPFLMHQILAVAALHLASLDVDAPRKSASLTRAYRHQHHAIRGIGDAVARISPDNCHALFAASSLLLISSFAATAATAGARLLDGVLDIFGVVRGLGGIVNSHRDAICKGALRAFMQCGYHPPRVPLADVLMARLLAMSGRLGQDSVSGETRAAVDGAVSAMKGAVSSTGASLELNMAVIWPMTLDDGFLDLARVRHPAALVVMAHYAVVLHSLGSKFWFFRGWGSALVSEIAESLGPSWQEEMRWPVSMVHDAKHIEIAT